MLICDLVINLISEIEGVRKLNDFGHLVNWVIIMQRELCSSSDDEEVVNVPQFLPSERSTRVTSNSDSIVEIVFSNLTKESCLEIKQAMVKWAEMNLKFNPGQREDLRDSKNEKLRLSGKFRIENGSGTKPKVIFLPSTIPPLSPDDLKDAWKVNGAVDRLLEVPVYERTSPQLPKTKDMDPNHELRPVQHHKCFNCGSYHHQIRNCRRESVRNGGPSDGDRSGSFSSNRGRGSRGRGPTRSRHGRSPEAESSRHSRLPSGSRTTEEIDRKRSRSRDYSEKDQRSKEKEFSVIKILTDSEEEGSEEGEVIESKKQKIDETKTQESDLEEGEILPCLPPPPPPETRGLEPPPPSAVNSVILPPSVLVHQNPVQAAPAAAAAQRQPISTVVYMARPNAQGMASPVVNLGGTPTVQIVTPLPQNNILLATRPSPSMPTTVLLQNGAFHRPVFAPSNGPRPTTVAFRVPPPPPPPSAHSGMLVYDRNGNHLLARPRLR